MLSLFNITPLSVDFYLIVVLLMSSLPATTLAGKMKCPQKQFILARRDGAKLCVTYEEFALAIGNAPDVLSEGESLNPGGRLISENGKFTLTLQHDGNLVLHQNNIWELWRSGKLGTRLVLSNGYLLFKNIVNGKNEIIWSSASENSQPNTLLSRLVVQNDGNVVIYSSKSAPIWATQTRGIDPVPTTFVLIKAETFTMGSPENEDVGSSDEDLHEVKITKDFEIQTTEVTQAQWVSVVGNNPSNFKSKQNCPSDYVDNNGVSMCPNNPVEMVSWEDVQDFIRRLNQKNDGYTYRLPTEAEWEYAARAGNQTAYTFGSGTNQLGNYAWYRDNSSNQTHAAANKKSNAWGLYDMHGNVWEWVQDWYGTYPSSSSGGSVPSIAIIDPAGSSSGFYRVIRGGTWNRDAQDCRSANRHFVSPGYRFDFVGFRLVRTRR